MPPRLPGARQAVLLVLEARAAPAGVVALRRPGDPRAGSRLHLGRVARPDRRVGSGRRHVDRRTRSTRPPWRGTRPARPDRHPVSRTSSFSSRPRCASQSGPYTSVSAACSASSRSNSARGQKSRSDPASRRSPARRTSCVSNRSARSSCRSCGRLRFRRTRCRCCSRKKTTPGASGGPRSTTGSIAVLAGPDAGGRALAEQAVDRLAQPRLGDRRTTAGVQRGTHVGGGVGLREQQRAQRGQLRHRLVVATAGPEQRPGPQRPGEPGPGVVPGRVRRQGPLRVPQGGLGSGPDLGDLGGQGQGVPGVVRILQPALLGRLGEVGGDTERIGRPER